MKKDSFYESSHLRLQSKSPRIFLIYTNSQFTNKGTANLTNSIKQVSNPESIQYGYGVCINFAGKIHSPIYVHKEHSFAIDPYASGNYGLIGMMHTNRIDWLNSPRRSSVIPLPKKLASVPIVYAYPGAQQDFLDGFIGKVKGLVVVGYGSGNVSVNMYFAIKSVIEKGLKVCLVTNCKYGGIVLDLVFSRLEQYFLKYFI